MNHEDAAAQVLQDAAHIMLPGTQFRVIAQIRREFAINGWCDGRLLAMLEEVIRRRLTRWSLEDKRGIWDGLIESGAMLHPGDQFENYPEDSVDMILEPELLVLVTEMLSLSKQ